MHISKEYLLAQGFALIFVVMLFGAHFHIGMTGGVNVGTALPSSGWDAITTSVSWLVNCLGFQLTGVGSVLSWIMWLLIVIHFFIPIVLIVRGD